jgi:hypothetical protein
MGMFSFLNPWKRVRELEVELDEGRKLIDAALLAAYRANEQANSIYQGLTRTLGAILLANSDSVVVPAELYNLAMDDSVRILIDSENRPDGGVVFRVTVQTNDEDGPNAGE